MFKIEVNKKLLPLKSSYFLYFACMGPVYGFLPTITRQLGYSVTTFGTVMMIISIMNMLIAPSVGIIFDKYRVKRKMFLLSITFIILDLIFFMFVPKITSEPTAELLCDSRVMLKVYTENKYNNTLFHRQNVDESIMCKLSCQDVNFYSQRVLYNQSDDSKDWPITTLDSLKNVHDRNEIDVTVTFKDMEYNESSYIFHVLSVQTNSTKVLQTTCQSKFKTICGINCSNKVIMNEATNKTYRGNVLLRPQFWTFTIAVVVLYISCTVDQTATHSVCLEILENKTEDYGKQKCWGSVGWGLSSISIGWLVDMFSFNKNEKNYAPVFYSGIMLMVIDLFVSTKIQVKETNKSKGKLKCIRELFSKHYVITFCIWLFITSLFHSIIIHFLFWYIDDLVSENKDHHQTTWLKTLQGLAQAVQCFSGEIPFYFWSGWIIRRIGHVNCMALSLGATAVRMYLYTIISNPNWVLLIELLNGISHALGFAVKMSYARLIAPPEVFNTMIGTLHFYVYLGESFGNLLGGYLFDVYGGLWLFRFFALTSALMCLLNIFSNILGLTKKKEEFDAIPVEINDNKII